MYKAKLKDCVVRRRYSRTHHKEMDYLFGIVVESETYKAGDFIRTTAIIDRNDNKNEFITTSGSKYLVLNILEDVQ